MNASGARRKEKYHRGNQQFMFHGAEKAGDEIVNGVIDKLVKRLEET